ncbi:MAG: flagellar protein FliS [Lachnospiraceae bacterium]|nr:flagellar protein FliS [Lachnospiraceae bacterium]
MTNEDKTYYTRRISQGNKSDIIVVVYDIYFSYGEDAKIALAKKQWDAFDVAVRHMSEAVRHLMEALDFSYDIAGQLYPLYDFVLRCMSRALIKREMEPLAEADRVMKELREAFIEVAKADTSGRQMQNAQTVTAGYTYGRGSLNEMTEGAYNRGFLA